jgi:hypothetical protein
MRIRNFLKQITIITVIVSAMSAAMAQTPAEQNSVVPFWNAWVNNEDVTEPMMTQMLTMARIEVDAVNVYADYCEALGHWDTSQQTSVRGKLAQYDTAAAQFLAQYSPEEMNDLLGDAQGFNVAREMVENMKEQFSTDSEADEQSAAFCQSVSEGIAEMPQPDAIERSKSDFQQQ